MASEGFGKETGDAFQEKGSMEEMNSSDEEPGVFSGLSAWFSTSVKPSTPKLWSANGGSIASVDTAMFLFSEDSQAEDTKSVFQSEAYVKEHLAIYRPDAVSDMVQLGNMKSCAIGKYYLPPRKVEDELRGKVSFDGSLEDSAESPNIDISGQSVDKCRAPEKQFPSAPQVMESTSINHQVASQESTQHITQCEDIRGSQTNEEYVDVSVTPMVLGKIREFTIGHNGCQVVKL